MQDLDSLISFFVVSHAVKPGTPGIDRCVTVDNPEGLLSPEKYVKLRPDDYLAYTKLRDTVEEYRKADTMPMVPVSFSNPGLFNLWKAADGVMATLFKQYIGIVPRESSIPNARIEQAVMNVVDNIINGNPYYRAYREYVTGHVNDLVTTCLYRLQESVCKRFEKAIERYFSRCQVSTSAGVEKFCSKFFKCSVSATFKKWLKAGIVTDDVDKGITGYDLKWARSTVCKVPVGAQMFTLCELARICRIDNGKMLDAFVQIHYAPGTLTPTLLQSHYHVLRGKMDLAIRTGIRQMMHGSFFRDASRLTEDELAKKSDALYCKARQLFIKRLDEIPGEYLDMLEESAKAYDENRDSSYRKSLSVQPLAIVHSLVRHSLSEAARVLKENGFDMPE